jgi:hypothetical protein
MTTILGREGGGVRCGVWEVGGERPAAAGRVGVRREAGSGGVGRRGNGRLGLPLHGNSIYTALNWDRGLNRKKYGDFYAKVHSTNLQQLFLV